MPVYLTYAPALRLRCAMRYALCARNRTKEQTMGCCGQKRSQMQSAVPAAPAAPRPAWPAPPVERGVMLRYRERGPVLVRGPVTGRSYEFSVERPAQAVEPRDAEVLLRTRHFVRA